MSICNVFMFLLTAMLLLSVYGEQRKAKYEDTCGTIVEVLCVKDALSNIAKAAKEIRAIADEIESTVLQQEPNIDSLILNVNHKTTKLNSKFPTSEYHNKLSEMNNIKKNDFVQLLKEEHYAIIYLIDSIGNLLDEKSTFGQTANDLFKKAQTILQNQILCNYRNILHVYSGDGVSGHEIAGIHIPKTRKRDLLSFTYNTYSTIIIRLTRGWIERIDGFIENLENKLV